MNKNLLFSLWLTLFTLFSSVAWGQVETIFSENMGTSTLNTNFSITANVFENSSTQGISFDGNIDVRTTSPSDYTGASKVRNVWFGTNDRNFKIQGINTLGYTDIVLSFGLLSSTANSLLTIEYSINGGENFFPLTIIERTHAANKWSIKTITANVPSVENLILNFKKSGSINYRLDDVKLTGVRNVVQSPTITSNPTLLTNFSTYIGTASISQSFNLTGSNLDGTNVVITAPASYEISESATGNYGETITIDTPTSLTNKAIYVRLKADNEADTYNDNLTISGGGITPDVNVSLEGTVNKREQTVLLPNLVKEVGTTLDLPLKTNENLDLVYSSSDPNIVSVQGNTLTFVKRGEVTITATAIGNDQYEDFTTNFTATSNGPIIGTLPHNESFANTLGDWTNVIISGNTTGSSNTIFNGFVKTADGVFVNGHNRGNTKAYLVSPQFSVGDLGALISFDLTKQYLGQALQLKYSTNYNGYGDPNDNQVNWQDIATYESATNNTSVPSEFSDIEIPVNGKFHVAFIYDNPSSPYSSFTIANLKIEEVSQDPPVVQNVPVDGVYNTALEVQLMATGQPISWEMTEGTLPTGLTFDVTTGKISGTPTEVVANREIVVQARNQFGTSQPKTIAINIAKANQTIADLAASYTGEVYGQIVLPAISDQGNPIEYTVVGTHATVVGNKILLNSVGDVVLKAEAVGNSYYNEFTADNRTITIKNIEIGDKRFVKVALTANMVLEDGEYVLASGTNAMNNTLSNKKYQKTYISIVDNEIVNPEPSIVWNINKADGQNSDYYISNNSFVVYSSSTDFATENITTANVSDNKFRWIPSQVHNDGLVLMNKSTAEANTQRAILFNETVFGPYATSNLNQNNSIYSALQLYKYIPNPTIAVWENGIWKDGLVPTAEIDAVILSNVTTGFTAKKVIVTRDVVVPTGVTINVEDNVEVRNGGSLTFEPESYLIQNSNERNVGNVTYKAQSKAMYRNDMSIWSSPVQGQKIRAFSPETLANRFWWYDEPTTNYLPLFIEDPTDVDFEPAKGIAIRVRNTLPTGSTEAKIGAFTGVLNNGNYSISATKTVNGYNLVGNPYPSNIDVDKFFEMNPDVEKIFIWTPHYRTTNPLFGNNYVTINKAGASGIVEGDIRTIAAGQGFFVQVTDGTTILFDNSLRTADAGTFRRRENNRYWLSLTKEGVTTNRILVSHRDGATIEEDHQYDAKSVEEGATKIYTKIGADNYSIQSRPFPLVENERIPLGITTNSASEMAISFENAEGIFAASQEVFVEDKALNVIHNLSVEPYVFIANEGITDDRFEIIYFNRTLATSEIERTGVKVYQHINKTVIESEKAIQTVKVYDALGRQVLVQKNIRSNKTELQIPKGVYYLTIELDNQTKVSEKVLIK